MAIMFGSPEALAVLEADRRMRDQEASEETLREEAADPEKGIGWYYVSIETTRTTSGYVWANSQAEAEKADESQIDHDFDDYEDESTSATFYPEKLAEYGIPANAAKIVARQSVGELPPILVAVA